MQEKHISVREWQNQYLAGAFNSTNVAVQCKAGWYDWFCRDNGLLGRLKKLAPAVLGITEPFILDNYYIWFKNNCPLNGPLYDDVRFEPLTGERDGKYFLIALDSPHEQKKWTLYSERFGFDAPEYGCSNVREMVKYVNQLGYELVNGITPEVMSEQAQGKLYIAYGSNLNLKQMKHRCPAAIVVGKSTLEGYKMSFRGSILGGVATVEADKGSSVPVLVWRISPKDEAALDRYEGVPRLYRKEMWPVEVDGKTSYALIYIMNEGYPIRRPTSNYYQTILEGYQSAGFDPEVLNNYAYAAIPSTGMVHKSSDSCGKETVSESSVPDSDSAVPDSVSPDSTMTRTIRNQILSIRDSGLTNMFDVNAVKYWANQSDYDELVDYLEEHPAEYCRFILTGQES